VRIGAFLLRLWRTPYLLVVGTGRDIILLRDIFICMEDLNKYQIVLLCLLLSFVTSIGTGVITFSLLNEAPSTVTQTINRIVEKTIERVVPVETQANVTQSVIKETVVVQEEDLIVGAIEKNKNSIVRIKGTLSPETESVFYGLGFIGNKEGLIVAPADIIKEGVVYVAQFANGVDLTLSTPEISLDKQFAFFSPLDKKNIKSFIPFTLFDSSSLKLGQSSIIVGGELSNTVVFGRLSRVELTSQATSTEEVSPLYVLETDVVSRELVLGEMLLNLSGDLIGVNVSPSESGKFISSSNIKKDIEFFLKK